MTGTRVGAVLVAAGSGTRLGHDRPKAFVEVAGRTLLDRACEGLLQARTADGSPLLGGLVVVVPPGRGDDVLVAVRALVPAGHPVDVAVVDGGATRQESVAAGLARLDPATTVVLVHDAARCLAPAALVERVAAAVAGDVVAVVPGLPVVDTVKQVRAPEAPDAPRLVERTVARERLVAVQTPQGFRADVLRGVHAAVSGDDATTGGAGDDAGMVEAAGLPVHVVAGDPHAFKVTVPLDLVLAEALVSGPADLL